MSRSSNPRERPKESPASPFTPLRAPLTTSSCVELITKVSKASGSMSKKSSSSLSSASCSVMLLGCSAKAGRNRQRCHKPLSRNERMRVCVGGKSWRGRGNTFAQLTFAMRPLNFVTAAASVTNRMRQLVSRSSAAAAVIETAHSDTSTHGEQKRTWERDHKPQGWCGC